MCSSRESGLQKVEQRAHRDVDVHLCAIQRRARRVERWPHRQLKRLRLVDQMFTKQMWKLKGVASRALMQGWHRQLPGVTPLATRRARSFDTFVTALSPEPAVIPSIMHSRPGVVPAFGLAEQI